MAARPKPWSRAARVAESLDAPASLDAPWYRVAPIGVREVADVLSLELDGGVPSAERPRIDRKLVPPYALIDVGHPRALLCSRAFAAGLLRAGVGGWSCSRADHLTARPVEGYACAWLEVRSVAGRMVRSEISASPGAVRAGLFLGGTPVAPVTIDLSTGTGHELAWTTEWIGAETSAWRALIASRRLVAALFDALAEAGDERWFAVEPVATTGSS
ncbi:MAG: hypothetical protein IT379_21455, partial [Deltaproteobacteria bacterium]|nr:hypothetical protein [Deltaproteobacteria bacterium]